MHMMKKTTSLRTEYLASDDKIHIAPSTVFNSDKTENAKGQTKTLQAMMTMQVFPLQPQSDVSLPEID